MSGVKGRSGRKPDPETKTFRALIDEHISPAQWEKILAALGKAAAEGNIPALRLLIDHRFGSARSEPASQSGEAVGEIVYLIPKRDGEVLPPDAIVVSDEKELLERTPRSAD